MKYNSNENKSVYNTPAPQACFSWAFEYISF